MKSNNKRVTIYVSPAGDDAADGRNAVSRGDATHGPVATLAQAVALARATASPCRIVLGDGSYFNTEVTLTAADSGLRIIAAPGAQPICLGGERVLGWREEGGTSPYWVADVPGVREGTRDFRALVVNSRFALRARYPESGAIRHESEFPVRWMSTTKGGWERPPTQEELTTLHLAPGSLPESVVAQNAELTIYHNWDESLVGIKEWDRERGIITFSTPAGHPPGAFGEWEAQARTFVLWNTREGLTCPGQWYLDRERGCIVYWPLDGEEIATTVTLAPTGMTVLRLAGTAEAPVCDIGIKGVTFALTTTPLLAGGFGALKFAGAIEGHYAHGLKLEEVTVQWAGGQGMRISNSDHVCCERCTIHTVGAGGAIFSGADGLIANTLIHHNGRTYPSALALRVSGERWRVQHNTLHHTPYSAINAGGTELRFEHNRFHHVMEELLDGAAIYLYAAKSCLLRGNYTYAVRDKQVHAYYLDEQSENSLVVGNVAIGVPWPIHNHMAWNCTLRDNVCLHHEGMHITFPNCDNFTLRRNVFACEGLLLFEPSYTGVARLQNNCFFSHAGNYQWTFHDRLPSLERNTDPTPVLPQNNGSVMADIGCRCDDGKISYTNEALAKALGLKDIDVSGAGCGRE